MFVGRTVALVIGIVVMTAFLLLLQLASDAVAGLEIDAAPVTSTLVLCGLLAFCSARSHWRSRAGCRGGVGRAGGGIAARSVDMSWRPSFR